ncbi:hypothetical protein Glove_84g86 [Diversispora epigaea]|uniref:non-specific serine/threonine protein kinase n=1 Tax=Diversispora epigaea TaxID=1348612 RepID=A0A397JBK0_9GLOM|nr:hypothetical protein Glove_84g86 [Diversispora epigaea]
MKCCPEGHSYENSVYPDYKNFILSDSTCSLCTKEHFIQEFETWSSGNANIDKIIQESQINDIRRKLHWISYDNFQNIEHIADGGHGSVYSAKLENGIKWEWNFIKKDWEYYSINKVALKEIKDSRCDMDFLKMVTQFEFTTDYYGISKNPSTQNYVMVMELFEKNLHNFLTNTFWDLRWKLKIKILVLIAWNLRSFHAKHLSHRNLHSGNILIEYCNCSHSDVILKIDLSSCNPENVLFLNLNNINNKFSGSIPYIPPEVLRGNEFTRQSDIYSFGGIMYEVVTAQQPFADQAHDTYLMMDICYGLRPKVPDFMLNWIPEWYLDLMYQCWSDDPFERPTAADLVRLLSNIVNNDIMRRSQLEIAEENQKHTSKSQKQELFELLSHSSKLHPQSCYFSRYIHTLHGLHDLLEEITSGKSSDPNLLFKSNESTTSNVDTHNIGKEIEIQSKSKYLIL